MIRALRFWELVILLPPPHATWPEFNLAFRLEFPASDLTWSRMPQAEVPLSLVFTLLQRLFVAAGCSMCTNPISLPGNRRCKKGICLPSISLCYALNLTIRRTFRHCPTKPPRCYNDPVQDLHGFKKFGLRSYSTATD